jgi:hypothetical protein
MEFKKGYLFKKENENTKIVFEGYLEINNEIINVVCFENVSKSGKKYVKIMPKIEKKK